MVFLLMPFPQDSLSTVEIEIFQPLPLLLNCQVSPTATLRGIFDFGAVIFSFRHAGTSFVVQPGCTCSSRCTPLSGGHDVCSNISVEKGKVSERHADEDKIDRDVDAGGWHPQANLIRVVAAEEVDHPVAEVEGEGRKL